MQRLFLDTSHAGWRDCERESPRRHFQDARELLVDAALEVEVQDVTTKSAIQITRTKAL